MKIFLGIDLAICEKTLQDYTDNKWLALEDLACPLEAKIIHLAYVSSSLVDSIHLTQCLNNFVFLCEADKKGLDKDRWLPTVLNDMRRIPEANVPGLAADYFRSDTKHENFASGVSSNWYASADCYIKRHKLKNIQRAKQYFVKIEEDNADPYAVAMQIVYSANVMQKLYPYIKTDAAANELYLQAKKVAIGAVQELLAIPEQEQDTQPTRKRQSLLFSCCTTITEEAVSNRRKQSNKLGLNYANNT